MMLTITNCYFDAARTSRIAPCDLRSSCQPAITPSDFFSCKLFNAGAGWRRQITVQNENLKSRFATMHLRRGETHRRLLDNRMEMKMERVVAIKRLGKMLGKSLGYRVDPKAPMADEREQAAAEAKALNAEFTAAESAESARRRAILEADAEYQRLKAETKRLREAKDKAWSKSHHYKFTVGTSNGMFFHVKAQGDSWEDVIRQLSKKAA